MKINTFIIFVLFFTFATVNFAGSGSRRNKLIGLIDQELREVKRLNKTTGSRNPKLLLRMAELLLEKARLVKEDENYKFLALSSKIRLKTRKSKFFKRSKRYFVQAQKVCYFILKKFKKFERRGDIYYILAYNSKEFQRFNQAVSFFRKAIKSSKRNSKTRSRSRLAIAEILYNQQRYKDAIPFYEKALKRVDSKWWTKDSYNLAWCYFKVGRRKEAIRKMKKVYAYSKRSKYVDVSNEVERDLSFFYISSGRTSEAIAFHKKNGKDIASNLLKVAKFLQNQGKFSSAESALTEALKHKTSEVETIEINIVLLSLYERFGKQGRHLKVSKTLLEYYKKGKLNKNQTETLKYHVERMSAVLQKQVASKAYKRLRKIRTRRAAQAVEYFKILSVLGGKRGYLAMFHAAETLYANGQYDSAIEYYDQASNLAGSAGNAKIQILSLEGMMASLGQKGVSKKSKDKYLLKVYKIYLHRHPKSKMAFKIYQRLFSLFYDKNDLANAEKILLTFTKIYSAKWKIQEAMLAKIMEYYRKKNNKEAIKAWVKRINAGDFKVSKKYARKLKLVLLNIQFEKIEKANSKGDKKSALRLYVELFKSGESTPDAKKNAAYNIAVLFHELGESRRTYKWTVKALTLMSNNGVAKFQASFLTIASEFFNKREFEKAAKVYTMVLHKICSKRSKNKNIFFKNTVVILLADGKVQEVEKSIKRYAKCGIGDSVVVQAKLDLINVLAAQEKWSLFKSKLEDLSNKKRLWPKLITPLYKLYVAYKDSGRDEPAKNIKAKLMNFYKQSLRKKRDIPLSALDAVAGFKLEELNREIVLLKKSGLAYPEKRFNNLLQKKFKKLDKVTSMAIEILKIRSGKGIVLAYKKLVESYVWLTAEIRDFVPPGKSSEYMASFKKEMYSMTAPLISKVKEFKQEAAAQIRKSEILADSNVFFTMSTELPVGIKYHLWKNGIVMDKSGGR